MTTSTSTAPTAAEIFAAIDAMDPARFADFLTADASLTFANNPPLVGTEAILAGTGGFDASIGALHHTIRNEWTVGRDTVVELSVHYERLDGGEVTIPVVSAWRGKETPYLADVSLLKSLVKKTRATSPLRRRVSAT